MITNIHIVQVESKAYLPQEEIAQIRNIQINNEIHIGKTQTQQNQHNIPVLRCEYSFSILYLSPSVGHIRLSGTVDYSAEGWLIVPTEELGDSERSEIMNAIYQNLIPLALMLSKAQGLPPAIPLPQIGEPEKKEEQSYYHG